jgi:SAM-dependent methyltransferase
VYCRTPVDERHRESADWVRGRIAHGRCDPPLFRAALTRLPPAARDAWVDRVLGLGPPPEDGPELPVGCVPYLPCSVDALLRLVEHAPVRASDLFVDVGSGVGRAATVVQLLTGAEVVGVEVQPALVAASRGLTARLGLPRISFIQGDAGQPTDVWAGASVFLLYCPFSGARLAKLLANLEPVARTRPIRVCCVDLPLPPCPWLEQTFPESPDLTFYRSKAVLGRAPP